jgi:hypothetical protein
MVRLEQGRYVATVRLYEDETRTSVCEVQRAASTMTEELPLPSGGDTSYAGMVEWGEVLWISYYSSHQEKTSIYLAQVSTGEA